MTFRNAVERCRDWMAEQAPDVPAEYFASEERLLEAALAEPCVRRFVVAEIYPPPRTNPVGRYSPVAIAPPVGTILRRQIASAGEEGVDAARRAITHTVALGYVAWMDSEGTTIEQRAAPAEHFRVLDRSPSELWERWVVTFNLPARGVVVPRDFVKQVADEGGAILVNALAEAGLLPAFGRRARLGQTGDTYAMAGMALRFVQTSNYSEESPVNAVHRAANPWPYEKYADS